jgi:hypothetical protein
MLTREKIQHGEGELVEENPLIRLRKRASHNENMASEEGISQDGKVPKNIPCHVGDGESLVRRLLGTEATSFG